MGADEGQVKELLAYNENVFQSDGPLPQFPLPDEPHVERWRLYLNEAQEAGVFQALSARLPQLRFPIEAGMSEREEYRMAVRRGIFPHATGLVLREPERMELKIHPGLVGGVPVITIPNRLDFEDVYRAILRKNEPEDVPSSLGAVMIGGFNNWDRINAYKQHWLEENSEELWPLEFNRFTSDKSAYQDRFILLSRGPYSKVSARELDMDEEVWLKLSGFIRLEHEYTHYFTRRLFSSMRNNVIDEILADYMGIVAAVGIYRSSLFLHFVGLESFPNYHQGRRLENYKGTLSPEAFILLQRLTVAAANNLEAIHLRHAQDLKDSSRRAGFLAALTRFSLEELAAPEALDFEWFTNRSVEGQIQ